MNESITLPRLNRREELVALLRGQAACPILSGLGEHGLLDEMIAGPFAADEIPGVTDLHLFTSTLEYLVGLGLLSRTARLRPRYSVTRLGRTVFTRYGSCALIHSYREYFERLAGLIVGTDRGPQPAVDRRTNVLGSGQLHAHKFFPAIYPILASHPFRRLIDIGCGDGEFIAGLLQHRPDLRAFGVDLSEIAIHALRDRFGGRVPGIVADGFDVAGWLEKIPAGPNLTVVSLWYVIHDFHGNTVDRSVAFFQELHARIPTADVVLGEIVHVPPEILAAEHIGSIMPEFLLFHALSGQKVLDWEQHQEVLRRIPYTLAFEALFDELPDGQGGLIPSSFVWQLQPVS